MTLLHHYTKLTFTSVGQDREINWVSSKTLGVLGRAELFEPIHDLLHIR